MKRPSIMAFIPISGSDAEVSDGDVRLLAGRSLLGVRDSAPIEAKVRASALGFVPRSPGYH